MRMHMHCGMMHVSGMLLNACSFMFMQYGMRRGAQPRFSRTAKIGDTQETRLKAVTTVWHACTILHGMSDAHATCHAARAHVERARGRSPPRGRPGRSIGTEAESVSIVHAACHVICSMPCHTVIDMYAACHVKLWSCKLARLADVSDSLSAPHERLTVPDAAEA
jgi:hypothetical protein